MIVTREEFIKQTLKILERDLQVLPNQAPECDMIEEAWKIIENKVKHILGGLR